MRAVLYRISVSNLYAHINIELLGFQFAGKMTRLHCTYRILCLKCECDGLGPDFTLGLFKLSIRAEIL